MLGTGRCNALRLASSSISFKDCRPQKGLSINVNLNGRPIVHRRKNLITMFSDQNCVLRFRSGDGGIPSINLSDRNDFLRVGSGYNFTRFVASQATLMMVLPFIRIVSLSIDLNPTLENIAQPLTRLRVGNESSIHLCNRLCFFLQIAWKTAKMDETR